VCKLNRNKTLHISILRFRCCSFCRTDSVGGADDISYFIKRVSFKLHETYPNPNRNIDKPPFEVSETGWGEFEIQIRITFVAEANEKPISFYHHLKLHPWNAPPPSEEQTPAASSVPLADAVHAWQYDEIVFTDPPRPFLDTLLANPPTPLSKFKKRAVPPHIAHPASVVATTRGTPEFSVVMEREERERLDSARKDVVTETDKWRAKLIEKEKELEMLKKELEKQT